MKTIQILVEDNFYKEVKEKAKEKLRTVSNYCLVIIKREIEKEVK